MSFELSSETDQTKLFLINQRDIEARLDVEYYQLYHYQDLQRLENSPYSLKKLDHICTRIVDGPFGSAIKANDYVEHGIPFIRVADVTHGEGTIKTNKLIFISEQAHEKIKRSKVVPNDVVIAKTGATMGAASVIPEVIDEANIRGDLGALTVKKERCTPQYVITYINTAIGQRLFWRLDSGGTRGRVVIGNLKKYPIIIPPKEIQEEIVLTMQAGYAAKKQKEAEAQQLLDSIDDYLLAELGIELPEQEENTVQSRIFTRRLSELSGERFDPFFQSLNKQDKAGKYDFFKLNSLAFIRKGTSITSDNINDGDIPVIAGGQSSPYTHDIANADGDVITVSASGAYSGYVWYHTAPIFASDCTIISSSNIEHLSNKYLFEYLKLEQQNIYNLQQGSGQPHVYPSDLAKIKIPVPPIDKQVEIVKYITQIRNQAKQLQQQAKAELEQAKKQVEAMILGEA